ncbi:MAG: peroxiredoxin family protein [Chloroflexota bacterium]
MSLVRMELFARVMPGQIIPAFSLRSTSNRRFRSADLVGTWLVLAFTDGVDDPRTRRMLVNLTAVSSRLAMARATVLAIAPVEADTGFLVEPGIAVPFPVLRDVAADVHRQFGAVDWSGQPAASLFITDRAERVVYRALGGLDERLPNGPEVLTLLDVARLSPRF